MNNNDNFFDEDEILKDFPFPDMTVPYTGLFTLGIGGTLVCQGFTDSVLINLTIVPIAALVFLRMGISGHQNMINRYVKGKKLPLIYRIANRMTSQGCLNEEQPTDEQTGTSNRGFLATFPFPDMTIQYMGMFGFGILITLISQSFTDNTWIFLALPILMFVCLKIRAFFLRTLIYVNYGGED
jgi:hypothetical protein